MGRLHDALKASHYEGRLEFYRCACFVCLPTTPASTGPLFRALNRRTYRPTVLTRVRAWQMGLNTPEMAARARCNWPLLPTSAAKCLRTAAMCSPSPCARALLDACALDRSAIKRHLWQPGAKHHGPLGPARNLGARTTTSEAISN